MVAQPGRASGCSCWLKMADRKTAYQAYRNRVVEGSIPSLGTTTLSNPGYNEKRFDSKKSNQQNMLQKKFEIRS